jgi:hypothetical protein
VVNQDKQLDHPGYRCFDARLGAPELAQFKSNGFVVLQAWHRTYDAILEETEETYLTYSAQTILDGMASQLTVVSAWVGNGVLQDSLHDADCFLAVAHSQLAPSCLRAQCAHGFALARGIRKESSTRKTGRAALSILAQFSLTG